MERMMDAIVKADSTKTGDFVRVNSNFKSLYPSVSFDGAFATVRHINAYYLCTRVYLQNSFSCAMGHFDRGH